MNEVLVTKDQLDSHKNCLKKALDYLYTENDFKTYKENLFHNKF